MSNDKINLVLDDGTTQHEAEALCEIETAEYEAQCNYDEMYEVCYE
jgi:hypothetical protein